MKVSRRVKFLATILVLIAVLCSGCHRDVNQSKLVTDVFTNHGFSFVWETKSDKGQFGADSLKQPHAVNTQSPPIRLEIDHAYLFHPAERRNFEELALQSLPTWIENAGCSVISRPKNTDDFIYPFVGGPLFEIRFQCRYQTYRLKAVIDPYLGATGNRGTTALFLIRDD